MNFWDWINLFVCLPGSYGWWVLRNNRGIKWGTLCSIMSGACAGFFAVSVLKLGGCVPQASAALPPPFVSSMEVCE